MHGCCTVIASGVTWSLHPTCPHLLLSMQDKVSLRAMSSFTDRQVSRSIVRYVERRSARAIHCKGALSLLGELLPRRVLQRSWRQEGRTEVVTEALGRARTATGSELGRSRTRLSQPMDIAARAWALALESCANALHLESPQVAADQMLQGDHRARMACCYGLAEQIAASLWSSQQDLQAVYAPECGSCPQDFCLEDGNGANAPCVHLLVWARQRTPALTARAATLGNALARVCQDMSGTQGLPNVLHLRVIEDSDLVKLFGVGQRDRWAARLEAYWLSMNDVVQPLYPRENVT
jgi:hypothetical protein